MIMADGIRLTNTTSITLGLSGTLNILDMYYVLYTGNKCCRF